MASSVRTKGCKFCPRHPTKELILVCKQCNNEPVCLTCLSTSHIGHNVFDLDIVAQEKYNYIQEINDTIEKENIPTIRTNLQIAEEKVNVVEQEILADIKRIEKHHRNLRDLLKQDATAAVSRMMDTIEANKQMYEIFESKSEQDIETLKGRMKVNTETCKSKNNILTLDEAKELENFKFEIPIFEKISTEKFHPGTNAGDHITAALGSVVHDDEEIHIAIPKEPEISIQQPQQKSSLSEQPNQNLEQNTSMKVQVGKRPETIPTAKAVTNIAEENVQSVSSNHRSQMKFYNQLVPISDMYKSNLSFPISNPVLFNDGTICDAGSYSAGFLTYRDSFEYDFLLPLSAALQFDKQEKVTQLYSANKNSFQISDMKVNSLDDKLYLMISEAAKIKSMWSLDRHTEKMVKLFDVKETCSKFAFSASGEILIGDLETAEMSLGIKVNVYSQTGECMKTKSYNTYTVQFSQYNEQKKITICCSNEGVKHYNGNYSKLEWVNNYKPSVFIHNICVCKTTGMVAVVVHGTYTESHKHVETNRNISPNEQNFQSGSKCITELLVLDEEYEEIYRKRDIESSCRQQLYIEFDRFGYLLLAEQKTGYIDIFKATTGHHMARVSLKVNETLYEFCCLNKDSYIVAKQGGSLQTFRYICKV